MPHEFLTPQEWDDLLDMSLDDALPQSWQARLDARLAADPQARADAQSLRAARDLLASAPAPRPEAWFVERALQAVLQEHQAETSLSPLVKEHK